MNQPNHFQYLTIALTDIRGAIERQIAAIQGKPPTPPIDVREALEKARSQMSETPALERFCTALNLTEFERKLLLLCAGMELIPDFPNLCAIAQNNPQRAYPTFGLALTLFPELPGGWHAINPASPLRHCRAIELDPGMALALSPLRIDEWVLHYLLGESYLDRKLLGLVKPCPENSNAALPASHQTIADRITQTWQQNPSSPAIQLCGNEVAVKQQIAATACRELGWDLYVMSPQFLPLAPDDLEQVVQRWQREALLCDRVLFLDCDSLSHPEPSLRNAIAYLIEHLNAPLIVATTQRWQVRHRPLITLDIPSLTATEQREIWSQILGHRAGQLNGAIEILVSQFDLTRATIESACAEAIAQNDANLENALWDSCRAQSRPRLQGLAQYIPPCATWEDLILPEPHKQVLHQIATHVRQRTTVYDTWGFAKKGARGLGISALFAGLSGTGKTMAAEVLAGELRLDLYRIDLSAVVSKYIGETEKNLRQVFDGAESSGAILLFDEADALFGKRSDVKDSHDRHANIEVSYLLQRMETYRGLAILTTNLPDALDRAFLRRIRFIVEFPFPDASQRVEIWQRVFPDGMPLALDRTQDFKKLARLNVAGGNIRSIAMNAAFLAAQENQNLTMKHLHQATQGEYLKLKKQLTQTEVKGWI